METFRVLKATDCDGYDRTVWTEVGTLESAYAYYVDADTVGKAYGEGKYLLISGNHVVEKHIVAERYYSDAPKDEEEEEEEEEDAGTIAVADAFTPPDPFSRKA